MSEIIKLIDSVEKNTQTIFQGDRTNQLLSDLSNLDIDEKNTLVLEAKEILSYCTPIGKPGDTTILALGYIQSGKTMSFTTVTTLAADNGFRVIIYLTGVKNNLREQTSDRLKNDLRINGKNRHNYHIINNPIADVTSDDIGNVKDTLSLSYKPVLLIPVLKHYKYIDELVKIFSDVDIRNKLKNNGVIIIDDEADQASMNTFARKNSNELKKVIGQGLRPESAFLRFSKTYESIIHLRNVLFSHSYIQYTATPQGPLLINICDLLSPRHHIVLTPGKAYTGGKTFFEEEKENLILTIPEKEVFHNKTNDLKQCPDSLEKAFMVFLLGVKIIVEMEERKPFLSMMVHADITNDANKKIFKWLSARKRMWADTLDSQAFDPVRIRLITRFKECYKEIQKYIPNKYEFEEVFQNFSDILRDTKVHLVIQGSETIDWKLSCAHILVGAEMLNRGFTIENLSVSYMPRKSKSKSTADTIQQRCRFFGYKRKYLDICRVYLPESSKIEYEQYIAHEEIMRNHLMANKSLDNVKQLLLMDDCMNPTRNNILSNEIVKSKLSGWNQFNALKHIQDNLILTKTFINKTNFQPYSKLFNTPYRNHRVASVDIKSSIEFLSRFRVTSVHDSVMKSASIQYIRYLSEKKDCITNIFFVEIAYKLEGGRERKLDSIDKINNIFAGRDIQDVESYPGDKAFFDPSTITIQLHKLCIKSYESFSNKELYTLGICYPKELSIGYVGIADN